MNWGFKLICLLGVLAAPSPGRAFKTHVQALREAVWRAVQGMEMPVSGDTVSLSSEGEHEGDWFVEAVLEEFLTGAGYKVIGDTGADVLSYRVLKLGLSCRARGWLGRSVERRAEVELALRWTQGGRVTSVGNVQGEYQDRFPRALLPELGHTKDPPFKAEVQGRNWGRVVEPFVVSAVVGGLLYLFYTSR
ncbi:MAG TPA: hypothetical protein EYP17_08070 [Candidatus Latescibacteria bacterium]|nr:hypothetical protein [Candidatus Latescibacterota bacterium]